MPEVLRCAIISVKYLATEKSLTGHPQSRRASPYRLLPYGVHHHHLHANAYKVRVLRRAMVNSKIEMKILRVVPCGDKILVDSEQRFSPWWWPSALLSPLGWQHHVIMNTVEHPSGCGTPADTQPLQNIASIGHIQQH